LTLDIIGDVAFSHDFRATQTVERWAEVTSHVTGPSGSGNDQQQSQQLEDVKDPLVKSLNDCLNSTLLTYIFLLLNLAWLEQGYLNRYAIRNRRLLNQAVDNIINAARKKDTMKNSLILLTEGIRRRKEHPFYNFSFAPRTKAVAVKPCPTKSFAMKLRHLL
jgi:hypothetical protein